MQINKVMVMIIIIIIREALRHFLTVKHGEDFLHHLDQDEDVGLGVRERRGAGLRGLSLQALAHIALLDFGVCVCCRVCGTLQTRHS